MLWFGEFLVSSFVKNQLTIKRAILVVRCLYDWPPVWQINYCSFNISKAAESKQNKQVSRTVLLPLQLSDWIEIKLINSSMTFPIFLGPLRTILSLSRSFSLNTAAAAGRDSNWNNEVRRQRCVHTEKITLRKTR